MLFLMVQQPLTITTHFPRKTKHLSLKEAILLALRDILDVISSELQRVADKFAVEVASDAFESQYETGDTVNYGKGTKGQVMMPLARR